MLLHFTIIVATLITLMVGTISKQKAPYRSTLWLWDEDRRRGSDDVHLAIA